MNRGEFSPNPNTSIFGCVFSGENLLLLLSAGAVGEIALEIFAWWVLPPILGRPMQPDILVSDLARSLFEIELSRTAAVSIHLALGLVIFPIVFVIGRDLLKARSTIISGSVFGVILWLIAQTILAPLAGRPFMLGLIPYSWASLIAHVLYAVMVALTIDKLLRMIAKSPLAVARVLE